MVVIEPVKESEWVVVDASLCSVITPHYESTSFYGQPRVMCPFLLMIIRLLFIIFVVCWGDNDRKGIQWGC